MSKFSRLREARLEKHLTLEEVGKLYGSSHSYIDQLENGKGFTKKVAVKLAEILEVSVDWLLDTSASLSEKENNTENSSYNNRNMQVLRGERNDEHRGVPYYNLTMLSQIEESFLDITDVPEYYIDAPPLNECTAYVQIHGESMLPNYGPGMIVGIQEIENFNAIIYGAAYYIITKKSWNSIKKVFRVHYNAMDENSFILRNSNPNFAGDLVIPKSAITSMHIVKGRLIIDNA